MEVLIVAKKPPFPAHDGEAIAIRQMIRGLQQAGNTVYLMYLNTEKHHAPEQDVANDLGIQVHAIEAQTRATTFGALRNLLSDLPYHVERFAITELSAAIYTHLKAHPDTIVQCEGLYTLVSAYVAIGGFHTGEAKIAYFVPAHYGAENPPTLPRAKPQQPLFVYRSHNLEHEIWSDLAKNTTGKLKKRYFELQYKRLEAFERHMLREVHAIVPISRADAAWYTQNRPEIPQYYLPTGMDSRQQNDTPVMASALYFIGGMDWLPNLEGLRWFKDKVWPILHAASPAITFEYARRNAPDGFATHWPAGCTFHGAVPDAAAFAADKAICIVPLLSGSGMKIKIAEAMQAGKVVVTTSKGAAGLPEGMENHLYIADTPEAFAQAILHCVNNPEHTRSMGLQARDYIAQHLNNTQLGRQLTQFYQTLRPA